MFVQEYRGASRKPEIIEIIGMPATGKSTYTRKFIASSPRTAVDVNSLLPASHFWRQMLKVHAALSMLFRHPGRTVRDFGIICRSKQKTLRDCLFVCTNWALVQWQTEVICAKKETDYVFDQGILQAVWSIALNAGQSNGLLTLLRHESLLPSYVVFLDEADEVLAGREKNREYRIRLQYHDINQVLSARKALQTVLTYVEKHYEAAGGKNA